MSIRARPLLGTLVEIRADGVSAGVEVEACNAAFNSIEEIHHLMSFHEAESDVSRLNRDAVRRPVQVDPRTAEVLCAALEVSRLSGGLFDCTVAGRLVDLRYLPGRRTTSRRLEQKASYLDITLTGESRVRFGRPLRVDLGGIAKGYAVDIATGVLQACGMTAGTVNAGGDLRVFGPEDTDIFLRCPDEPVRTVRALRLRDGAVATTAAYFSTNIRNGKCCCPLVDPRTGRSVNRTGSISVIAPDCMHADALTKVIWLSGDPRHPALSACGAAAVMINNEGDLLRDVA